MDIQDQPPVFINAPYSATIPENTDEDTSILRIGARDGDVGDPRTVRIEIVDDHLGYFKLVPVEVQNNNRDTNYLISYYDIVTTDIPLDREHADVLQNGGIYTFTVKVILEPCIYLWFLNYPKMASFHVFAILFLGHRAN